MSNPIIKICGIKTPKIASQAALAGADYIGIIFHPKSKRYVAIDQAKAISEAAIANGAIPVAVFVNQSAIEMNAICFATNIKVIQLHGETAKQEHHLLPATYQRFYVQSVSPDGGICDDKEEGLLHCDSKRDYLLFDNIQAGKGQTFDWNQFHYDGNFRMGLAGGLTPENVTLAIKKFNPAIVDVSGGVENQEGEKDISRIKQFINAVNHSV